MAAARRKLRPTEVRELTRGESDDGRGWVLYAVEAVGADGTPIRAELRSFEKLPVGELVEVEVKPRPGNRGVSYTLRRPRAGNGLAGRVAELEQRVQRLEQQVRQPSLV